MIIDGLCSQFTYVDIYQLCDEYYHSEGMSIALEKIDKNKSDAKSRWAIKVTEVNRKTHDFFLANLSHDEVLNNFENKLEQIKTKV